MKKILKLVATTKVEEHVEDGKELLTYELELVSENSVLNVEKSIVTFGYILNKKSEKPVEEVVGPVPAMHNMTRNVHVDLDLLTMSIDAAITKESKTYKQMFDNLMKTMFIEFCNSKSFYGLQWVVQE